MTGPMVSVCIPVFNGARFISAAIESVLSQSYADYELLIIDNSSTDGTVGIARSAAGRDRRIRLLVNESNLGMVENWNRCLAEARGEFIRSEGASRFSPSRSVRSVSMKTRKRSGTTSGCITFTIFCCCTRSTCREPRPLVFPRCTGGI